mmetsp:Transcript_1109/g.1695  ORF Transcript_1109/g.1695 Transcript_1109/m.1695 type:complete len:191 (-) Transcript_1109:20-592(-)
MKILIFFLFVLISDSFEFNGLKKPDLHCFRLYANGRFCDRKNILKKISLVTFSSSWIAAKDLNSAFADSTGKFSSKATATRRYLPRIKNASEKFDLLKDEIEKENWGAIENFANEILPDAKPALELYGSAQKRGEYPDANSKKFVSLAKEFESNVVLMSKAAKANEKEKVREFYSKAEDSLKQYFLNGDI